MLVFSEYFMEHSGVSLGSLQHAVSKCGNYLTLNNKWPGILMLLD